MTEPPPASATVTEPPPASDAEPCEECLEMLCKILSYVEDTEGLEMKDGERVSASHLHLFLFTPHGMWH